MLFRSVTDFAVLFESAKDQERLKCVSSPSKDQASEQTKRLTISLPLLLSLKSLAPRVYFVVVDGLSLGHRREGATHDGSFLDREVNSTLPHHLLDSNSGSVLPSLKYICPLPSLFFFYSLLLLFC